MTYGGLHQVSLFVQVQPQLVGKSNFKMMNNDVPHIHEDDDDIKPQKIMRRTKIE